jgi:hypothetical protein
MDQTNFQRNRAAFLFHAAAGMGLHNETAFHEALTLMGEYRWNDASAVLWELVEPDMRLVGGSMQPYPPVTGTPQDLRMMPRAMLPTQWS